MRQNNIYYNEPTTSTEYLICWFAFALAIICLLVNESTTSTAYLLCGLVFVLAIICLFVARRSRRRVDAANQSNASTNANDVTSTKGTDAPIISPLAVSTDQSISISSATSQLNAMSITATNRAVYQPTKPVLYVDYEADSPLHDEISRTQVHALKMKDAAVSSWLRTHSYSLPETPTQTTIVRRKVVPKPSLDTEAHAGVSSLHHTHSYTLPETPTQTTIVRRKVLSKPSLDTEACDEHARPSRAIRLASYKKAECFCGEASGSFVRRRSLSMETHAPRIVVPGSSMGFIYSPSPVSFNSTPPSASLRNQTPPRIKQAPKTKLFDPYVIDSEPEETKLDLRGLRLDPAMGKFRNFFNSMKKMYTHNGYKEEDRYIYVVTGYGKLNLFRPAVIKPTVQSFIDRNSIRHNWLNIGLVMIDFCEEKDEVKDKEHKSRIK